MDRVLQKDVVDQLAARFRELGFEVRHSRPAWISQWFYERSLTSQYQSPLIKLIAQAKTLADREGLMVSMYSTVYVDDIREIKEENPFESMMSRFDRAAQLLDLDPDLYAVLRFLIAS